MAEESRPSSPTISGHVVTPQEFTIWQTLRIISPVGWGDTDEVTALVKLTALTEDEVLIGLGGLLARGQIKRAYTGTRAWYIALPDLSLPS